MFCRNCGQEIGDNVKFCNHCGMPVKVRAEVPSNPPVPPAPSVPPVPPVPPVQRTVTPPPVKTPAPAIWQNAGTAAAQPVRPEYSGKSRMQSLRIVSGVMFLVIGILQVLLSLLNRAGVYSMTGFGMFEGGRALLQNLLTTLSGLLFSSLIPGIASLVLSKPAKVKNIILTVILGVSLLVSLVLSIAGYSAQAGIVELDPYNLFSLVTGFLFGNGRFFCTLMAVVSIFMPENLVGEPAPVKAKAWKIVAGIFNILNAVIFLLAGLAGIIAMFAVIFERGAAQAYTYANIGVGLFPLGIWMLVGAILSISCSHGKHKPLSSAYADLRVLTLLTSTLTVFIGSAVIGSGLGLADLFSGMTETGTAVLILVIVLFVILILWYLVCTVISMITAFNKKKAA